VALACSEANVFLTGRRESKLKESIQEAEALGSPKSNCIVVPADVTSEEQIAAAVGLIEKTKSSLRGVVHSAGVAQPRRSRWPLTEETLESWRQILATNVLGAWLLTKGAFPLMVRGGAARVLLLSSEAGWADTPGFGQYNVSKAALNSLGASLAAECALHYPEADVQVNVVVPGEARTEMNQGSETSPYTLASLALLLLSHPAGGPNGRFFHRDGRHLEFGQTAPHASSLQALDPAADMN